MTITSPEVTHAPRAGERGLLQRAAVALSSTLELSEVLHLLSEMTLDAVNGGTPCSASVFVLDGRRLVPAAAVGAEPDQDRFQSFLAMPPIDLDDDQWAVVAAGRPVLLESLAGADLVPPEWVEQFGIGALALFPLLAGDRPCGVMAVDWPEPRPIAEDDVRVLGAIASYAGLALRNAQMFEAARRRARIQEALAHSAAGLALPMEPEVVARRLVDCYVDLLGARTCGVALLDESREQIGTVVVHGAPTLHGPMPLSEVPAAIVERLWDAWADHKRAVELDDHPWLATAAGGAEAGVRRYLFVPLVVEGHTRGVVGLGFDERTRLRADEITAAEGLAGIAAAALERHELLARQERQVRRLDALYRTSAALGRAGSLDDVLGQVCEAFEALLGTSHCSVNLLDDPASGNLQALAVRGEPWFARRPGSLGALAHTEVAAVAARWAEDTAPAVYHPIDESVVPDPDLVPEAVRSVTLFPLALAGEVLGAVVAGFPEPVAPAASDLGTGQALADLAAAAIDRAGLDRALRLRLRQVEALYQLSDVVAGAADLNGAVQQLNGLVQPDLPVTLGSVAIAERPARQALGGRNLDREERAAVKTWKASLADGAEVRCRRTPGGLLVPVVHRHRVLGALRVACDDEHLDPADEALLVAIGAGCAEVVHKATLRRELAERDRELVVAAERERIARDLHDSVGQVLMAIGLRVTQLRGDTDDAELDERLAEVIELAREGSDEVRQAIYALLFLQARQQGLVASLRELARRFESTTGIADQFEIMESPVTRVSFADVVSNGDRVTADYRTGSGGTSRFNVTFDDVKAPAVAVAEVIGSDVHIRWVPPGDNGAGTRFRVVPVRIGETCFGSGESRPDLTLTADPFAVDRNVGAGCWRYHVWPVSPTTASPEFAVTNPVVLPAPQPEEGARPTSQSAVVTIDRAPTGRLGAGDVIGITFDMALTRPPPGASITVRDEDGVTATMTHGADAIFLVDDAGTTLTARLFRDPPAVPSLPADITGHTGISSEHGETWDVATSPDRRLESGTAPPEEDPPDEEEDEEPEE